MDSFKPGDPEYIVFPSLSSDEKELIELATTAIVRLFEAAAITKREDAQREAMQAEAAASIECFRTGMQIIEKQLDAQNVLEADRQRSWFAIADKLIDRGKEDLALIILEKAAKEGRASLVQPLIDYHRTVSLGMVR